MEYYVTSSELAKRIRRSVGHVRALARAGVLPSVRLVPGGRWLFDPAAVEAALQQAGVAAVKQASPTKANTQEGR
jgi:excisionase family DNA binding protein